MFSFVYVLSRRVFFFFILSAYYIGLQQKCLNLDQKSSRADGTWGTINPDDVNSHAYENNHIFV